MFLWLLWGRTVSTSLEAFSLIRLEAPIHDPFFDFIPFHIWLFFCLDKILWRSSEQQDAVLDQYRCCLNSGVKHRLHARSCRPVSKENVVTKNTVCFMLFHSEWKQKGAPNPTVRIVYQNLIDECLGNLISGVYREKWLIVWDVHVRMCRVCACAHALTLEQMLQPTSPPSTTKYLKRISAKTSSCVQ